MIDFTVVADVVLGALAVPVVAITGYLFTLTILSTRAKRAVPAPPQTRFVFVVPAHDEAVGIAATVESLLAVDYPATLRRVLVVADNCSDDTALRARASGALVLERTDAERRGKGYALALAFDHVLADGDADAVVVVDADTVVSKGLLRAFAARLDEGESALQAHYGVRNPDASWRTRLMAIALAAYHGVRSLGRERLALSCGLRGNGMCFTTSLLREVPNRSVSLVEDVEYGIELGRAGHRVAYVHDAEVLGEMVSGAKASAAQRQRWESGRAMMVRTYAGPLLRKGLADADPVALDLGIDIVVPPLATIAIATVLGGALALGLSLHAGHVLGATWLWAGCALALGAYVARGWQLSGTGFRGLTAFFHVPGYVLWKLSLPLRRRAAPPGEWVRTAREGEAP